MVAFVADENFSPKLLDSLQRLSEELGWPVLDVVRVQDVGLRGAPDPIILAWAAAEERVVLTHDAATMPHHVYQRLVAGLPVPGVVVVKPAAFRLLAEDLLILAHTARAVDWADPVVYLPL